ncbi:MBL fold metallo-hydrolase [Caballeronia sp. EK]|uniref:MBL fold metallo-hydrolase n=1 Tax=unclassified Caballeronia TaxID=2646786 RepID=UPI0016566D98|nr:MBL fold metallo-hydrolase [Caballeronia sp. EK]MBC8642880.1 MBL fold metallo-hydrolase [Caballeronia sp. EK]
MKNLLIAGLLLCLALVTAARAVALTVSGDEKLPAYTQAARPGTIMVTFLGTTTLLFDDGDTQILVDAFITRPSIANVALDKVQTAPSAVNEILKQTGATRVKGIFVTHAHYDHALDVAYLAHKTGARLYGSNSVLNIGRGGGLKGEQLVHLASGQGNRVGNFEVTPIPSKHSTPIRFINDDLGQQIRTPLTLPAPAKAFVEGRTYDLLIRNGGHSILVVASANFEAGALYNVHAETVFLSTAGLLTGGSDFRARYYDNTVGCARPSLVIPVHWDNFFKPLSKPLAAMPGADSTLNYLRGRLQQDHIRLGVMEGLQRVKLFDANTPIEPYAGPGANCLDYD